MGFEVVVTNFAVQSYAKWHFKTRTDVYLMDGGCQGMLHW